MQKSQPNPSPIPFDATMLGQLAANAEELARQESLSDSQRRAYRLLAADLRRDQMEALHARVNAVAIVAAVKQEPEYSEWPEQAPDFPHANVLRQRPNTSQRPGLEGDVWTGVRNGAIFTVLLLGAIWAVVHVVKAVWQ